MLDAQTVEKPLTQVKSKADLRKELDASGAWTVAQIEALFDLPFNELMLKAQETHKAYSQRVMWNWRPCCRLRPVAALRIVDIAPKLLVMTLTSKLKS